MGEGNTTQLSCYRSPLLLIEHLRWAKSCAGTKTPPPQSGMKSVGSKIYLHLVHFLLPPWLLPWWAPSSSLTWTRSVPSALVLLFPPWSPTVCPPRSSHQRGASRAPTSQGKKPKSSLQPPASAPALTSPSLTLQPHRPPCCSSNTSGMVLPQGLYTCWLPVPGMLFPQIFSQLLLILPKHHLLR